MNAITKKENKIKVHVINFERLLTPNLKQIGGGTGVSVLAKIIVIWDYHFHLDSKKRNLSNDSRHGRMGYEVFQLFHLLLSIKNIIQSL